MDDLAGAIDQVAVDSGFSGVVRIDIGNEVMIERAYGFADRAHSVSNTSSTIFGIASATKGVTAMLVMRLVELGTLALATPVRDVLGVDLGFVDDRVTIEHLLCHRSGIGDYLDEDELGSINDYVMPVPVHQLLTTEDYVVVLDGHPSVFDPGAEFAYCNGGYVLLALIAERAARIPFHELVDRHVCQRAGLTRTSFLRSDELPGNVAVGYLAVDGLRTNVFHLPIRGSGDGGMHSTIGDIHQLWAAFRNGEIVSAETVSMMTAPRTAIAQPDHSYGLGFWLKPATGAVVLHGYDAGVSCRSIDQPATHITHTVISNSSQGAGPMTRLIEASLHT